MENVNPYIRQITSKISIEIVPSREAEDLNKKVWAINWFSYQRKWLYYLYYRLAAPFAAKMGGRMFFKGHNVKTLYGDETLSRQTLLIVSYPSIDKFLDMVMIKTFQLISLLRVKAVKDFVFGFTRRIDEVRVSSRHHDKFMVFHYQGNLDTEELLGQAATHQLELFFHSEKIGQVKRIEEGKELVLAPFFMDGIILFTSDSDESYNGFIGSDSFIDICSETSSSYAGLFTRVK